MQCSNSVTPPYTFHQTGQPYLTSISPPGTQTVVVAKKRTVENSRILARRYSRNPEENSVHQSEGYIHEHYSPIGRRKFLPKSKSVDVVKHQAVKVVDRFVDNGVALKNKSTSNFDILVNEKHKFSLTGLFKKLDSQVKSITKNKKTGTICTKPTTDNLVKNPTIDADPAPNKNTLLSASQLYAERPNREIILRKPTTKDTSKEIVPSDYFTRQKSKYSPPPEPPTTTQLQLTTAAKQPTTAPTVTGTELAVSNSLATNPKMLRGGLKLKERLMVAVSVFAVAFTLVLVVDLQMDLGISGKHLVSSHGKIKYVVQEEGPGSAYNSFRNRLLQKMHR